MDKETTITEKKVLPENAIELELPSGKKAVAFEGTNKAWLKCLMGNSGDIASSYCEYASLFVEVDGKKLVQEDFENMSPKEFSPIFIHLSSVLF